MISLRGVTKIYRTGDVLVPALQDVDLDIDRGEFLAIIGTSGSGKSTLMNVVGCLDRPTRGTYTLEGRDVQNMTDAQLARVRRYKIGFVFQSFNLLPRLPALAQVELPLIYRGGANRRQVAARALADVGLGDRMHHTPAQLSGGQQQRVAIARAIVSNPSVILADEPTGQLDTKTTSDVMEIFVRLNRERGITVIFVTHEPEVAAYTNRTVALRDGRVVSDTVTQRPAVVPFPGVAAAAELPKQQEAPA